MARRRSHVPSEAVEGQVASAAFRVPNLWVESQAKAFEQFDEAARRWLDRRREALDEARQSFGALKEADNVRDLVRIQHDWALASMHRLTADFAEFGGMALNLTRRTTSQIVRVGEEAADNVERAFSALPRTTTS